MKKNIVLFLLIGAMLLAACTPAAPAPAAEPPAEEAEQQAPAEEAAPAEEEAAPAGEQVTITYAIWEQMQAEAHEQIIAAFEAKHPEINIDLQIVPWTEYWNKLQTGQAGGESFDTFWMNGPNFQVYASKGVLMDLQPVVDANSIDMSVYPESLVNLYTYNGHVYGFPKDFDTIALYYNKDVFDKAGVAYPDDTWTWDTLRETAKQLTTEDVYGFASMIGDQIGYWNFVYQNGGVMLNEDATKTLIDDPAACDAVKYLYGFIEDGSSPDTAITTSVDPSTQMFPGGNLAMLTGGSWIAKFLFDSGMNVGVAPLPQGKQRATIIHGLANVAWANTQHPKEAQEWVKFLGSEEAERILAETGAVIPAYNGLQQAWVDAIPEMDLQVFIDALEYSVPYPNTPVGPEWSAKIYDTFAQVWSGNISIDDACATAAEAANPTLTQ